MINFSRTAVKGASVTFKQIRNSSGGALAKGENAKNSLAFTYKKNAEVYRLWRKIWYFVALPSLIGAGWCGYRDAMHHLYSPRQEYVEYNFLNVRTNPFLWGDGNHSFFHNPEYNWVPGVGYEAERRYSKSNH